MTALAPARRRAPPPAPAEIVRVALGEIVGLDPANARRLPVTDAEIAELADDIAQRGLINPLVLRAGVGGYRVLAGGRRWRALAKLGAATAPARLFEGTEDEARLLSLAENLAREALHPLDEADRVADLAREARFETVARMISKPVRFVRECVALSNLPDAARELWARGKITSAQARALTLGERNAVEALLGRADAAAILGDARAIRAALLPRAVPATSPAARFVGVDAYLIKGGSIHEDLFDNQVWFEDSALLARLEREKLAAEAEALRRAEGWGFVIAEFDDAVSAVAPDYTADELAEIARLEKLETPEADAAVADIARRAILRRIAFEDRIHYGVHVGLDSEGGVDVMRGLVREIKQESVDGPPSATPIDEPASASPLADAAAAAGSARSLSRAEPAAAFSDAPILPYGARQHALRAASLACADAMRRSFNPALRIALAALLSRKRSGVGVNLMKGPGGGASAWAMGLAKLPFAEALEEIAKATFEDVAQAFAEVLSQAVDLRDVERPRDLIGALLGDDAQPIAAHFDYAQFFALAGRAWSLIAIRDCLGEAGASERAWMRDAQLAEEAALQARAARWIPDFLRRET